MAGKGKFGDFNGNGKLGMDDIISLVIGGIAGFIGIYIANFANILSNFDPETSFVTAVIVVLFAGIAKGFGIGK